ncbi:MAG: hypothetical protein E6G77_13315 [Alphaproteobacteria bacterium]|nr:MAG: hypothetical protein E6G77_13315 [Alphaproteobacteria bacterium]
MRTTPLVFITFTALSLSATGALAGGSWCAITAEAAPGTNRRQREVVRTAPSADPHGQSARQKT